MTGRIRERAVFDRLRTEGRRAGHGVVWCTWVDDTSVVPPRVAYAVGRGVGGAVVRNRVRRRLRALLAAESLQSRLLPGYYLVGARPSAAHATFAELGSDLAAALRPFREAPRG